MNPKTERDKAMKKAYAFAREGNATWAQLWIDRANSFLAITPHQLAHANKLLKSFRRRKVEVTNEV